jgi:hypothetical protein
MAVVNRTWVVRKLSATSKVNQILFPSYGGIAELCGRISQHLRHIINGRHV